jgi:hypothetical protein
MKGRKPGDGVLKLIDPADGPMRKQALVVYGPALDEPVASMVRHYRSMAGLAKKLATQEPGATVRRMHEELRATNPDLKRLAKELKRRGLKLKAKEVGHYLEEGCPVRQWFKENGELVAERMMTALWDGNLNFFETVVKTIQREAEDPSPVLPLDAAILAIVNGVSFDRGDVFTVDARYWTGAPDKPQRRLTIAELRAELVKQGRQDNDSEIYRSCRRVHYKLVKSKSGPKPQQV